MQTTKTLIQAAALLGVVLVAPPIVAQTCASDADCSQGMVCHSQTVTTCSGGTAPVKCDPNMVCAPTPVDPPTCSDSTTSQCVYRWDLPCNADADCGDGFVCQPSVIGTCSGSGGVGTGQTGTGTATATSGGAAPDGAGGSSGELVQATPPSIPDGGVAGGPACTTSTSFPGTCQSKVTTCTSDADCPSVWTCVALAVGIAAPQPAAVDAGALASAPPDNTRSTTTSTDTSTLVTTKTCQRPSTNTRTGGGSQETGDTGGGNGTTQGTLVASVDAGVGKGTTPSVPPSPTANGSDATATATSTATNATPARTGGGGCSVASGGPSGGAFLVLGLAAALAALTRKRGQR